MRRLTLTFFLLLILCFLSISFQRIDPIRAMMATSLTFYIRANGSIDPQPAPISTIDNVTYTLSTSWIYQGNNSAIRVERDNIVVNGANLTIQGTGSTSSIGFDLTERNNVTVKNTEIKDFKWGLYLFGSSNYNKIIENKIATNKEAGIYIHSSNYNSIVGNHITENWMGILTNSSSSNSISGNTIRNNTGGFVSYDSSHNTISGNNITNNNYGLWLSSSSENAFYYNNFTDNANLLFLTSNSINTWDDGSRGNYWSDYTKKYPNATEIDDSGIWDTPYVIDSNNIDHYPIVPEFPSFVIIPLFMISTLLAVTVYKRKHII